MLGAQQQIAALEYWSRQESRVNLLGDPDPPNSAKLHHWHRANGAMIFPRDRLIGSSHEWHCNKRQTAPTISGFLRLYVSPIHDGMR